VLGPEHPDTLRTRHNVRTAANEDRLRQEHMTEQKSRAVLAQRERLLGAEHPDTLDTCRTLALCLKQQQKFKEALPYAQRVLAGTIKERGQDDPATKSAQLLVQYLTNRDSGITKEVLPESSRKAFVAAKKLQAEGKYAEAEQATRALIAERTQALGPEDGATLSARALLPLILQYQTKYAAAEAELRALLPTLARVLGEEHPITLRCQSDLCDLMHDEGQYTEAEPDPHRHTRARCGGQRDAAHP
jgi:tetratricopeptide (TPR) repeat protein